jgi:hypothetical protein
LGRGLVAGLLPADDGQLFTTSMSLQSALLQILRCVGEAVDADRAPEALKRILVDAAVSSVGGQFGAPIGSFAELEGALAAVQPATRAALERLLQAPVGSAL